MSRSVFHLALMALLAVFAVASTAAQAARVALIIGNDDYTALPPLEKAVADAEGYAELARAKGFDQVIDRYNLTRQEMDIAIAEFLQVIGPGDTAMFVYSGHGWSDGAQNFLVGIDAPKKAPQTLLSRISIPLQNGATGVLDEMRQRGASLKVAIVDACRDNPFAAEAGGRNIGLGRGLSRVDPPRGTFVVFSAGTGQVALDRLSDDDPERHGVFTRVFLPLLHADTPLLDAVKQAQETVFEMARDVRHDQEPAYYDQVRGNACLSPSCARTGGIDAAPPTPSPVDRETVFWTSIANSTNAADFEAYLAQYPKGHYAPIARNRLAALTPPVEPEPEPDLAATVTECDRLAAITKNPENVAGVEPVEWSKLKSHVRSAIAACREATEQAPDVARFQFQLARALEAADEDIEAVQRYENAANLGSRVAMRELAFQYKRGEGVSQSYHEARRWFERAADLGDARAMNNIGVLYARGQGVPKDDAQARVWYEKAALLGDDVAMNNLALLYKNGRGGPKDYAKAKHWYEEAIKLGHRGALNNLGVLYKNGYGVEQDYGEARRLYQKAAERGDAVAMTNLALLYRYGEGVSEDFAEARRWLDQAVKKGDRRAMHHLGALYEDGRGVAKDTKRAAELYLSAMAKGYSRTFNNLRDKPSDIDVDVRRSIQRFLIEKGYLSGGVDGVFGSRSKAALDAYRKDVGG